MERQHMSQPTIAASAPTSLLRRTVTWRARASQACSSADNLLLRRFQPDPVDQTPDLAGAWRRIQWFLHGHTGGAAGRKSRSGDRQPAVYAPLRRRAVDPADLVQERDLLDVRDGRAAGRGARASRRCRWLDRRLRGPLRRALFAGALSVDPDLVDGAVPRLRHDTRSQRTFRRRRTVSPVLPLALVRGQAYASPPHSPAHTSQSPDRSKSNRSVQ